MKVRLDGRIGLLLALLAVLLVGHDVPFRFFYPSTVPLGEVSSRYHAGFLVAEQYHRARELAGLAKGDQQIPILEPGHGRECHVQVWISIDDQVLQCSLPSLLTRACPHPT